MTRYAFIIICTLAALLSCKKQNNQIHQTIANNYDIEYAQGFDVVKTDDYIQVTLRNPWDSSKLLQSYVLIDKNKELPVNLPKGKIIRTPIATAVTGSTTQCTMLEALNNLDIVTGVCEPQYIKQDYITNGVANGKIVNLGKASNPNTEAIIMLNPDVVFSDPVTGQSQANIERSRATIVQTADYTEPHPLGRAEWIKFYGLLVDKEQLADSLFTVTKNNYNAILEQVSVENAPTVFIDTRYQGTWNVPGGKSYMAHLLKDAGSRYIWADNESSTFLPLSFEAVLDKAGNADKWLIRYNNVNDMTLKTLENEYKPHAHFNAFKTKEVYGCNAMYSHFFEDLPIHPDYILQDMAAIFHPELFPDYTLRYYKKITD